VVSPATLQWGWLGLGDDNSGQWHSIVNATNGYYKYVFASVPIAILELPSAGTTSSTTSPGPAYLGQASFGAPGDSLSFNSTIPGVVGFEEGGIQVYGIPSGVPFVIKDPGLTSSRIVVVIPQNETSVVGYELNSESTTSLGLEVTPSEASLGISASTNASLSVSFFSTGLHSYSVFNATSIPVTTAQTATFGIPNWEELNDSQLSPSLQIFQQGSTSPVATYTLTNGQNGLPAPAGSANNLLPVVALSATLAIGVALIFLYSRRKSRSESHPGRLGPIWMKYQQINARIPYVLPIYEPHPSSVFG
jgi:hypothetical protein